MYSPIFSSILLSNYRILFSVKHGLNETFKNNNQKRIYFLLFCTLFIFSVT